MKTKRKSPPIPPDRVGVFYALPAWAKHAIEGIAQKMTDEQKRKGRLAAVSQTDAVAESVKVHAKKLGVPIDEST